MKKLAALAVVGVLTASLGGCWWGPPGGGGPGGGGGGGGPGGGGGGGGGPQGAVTVPQASHLS